MSIVGASLRVWADVLNPETIRRVIPMWLASIRVCNRAPTGNCALCESTSTEDDVKALLHEMVVVCQDFQNRLASHGRHGYAVHKAVSLVIALLIQT